MLNLASKYARLKGTFVIEGAYKLHDDGSITFVLASGPKLTRTEAELLAAIQKLEEAQKAAFGSVIHTNEEARESVKTLTPTRKPKEK